MYAVIVRDLCKSYKSHQVLNSINFQVGENQIFGLVGLNGIGKTTTLKIMLGLSKADSGDILIFGQSCANAAVRKDLAFLPEKFNPSSFLTGREFLKIALQFHNKSYNAEEAAKFCEELDFNPEDLAKPIGKYSKGMGQKLGLASVFLSDAKLLVLDEPMSGLDPRARIFLKRKLLEAKEQGKTVFFSSHIMADVEEICDQVGIIHNGEIKFQGPIANLLTLGQYKSLEEAFLRVIE